MLSTRIVQRTALAAMLSLAPAAFGQGVAVRGGRQWEGPAAGAHELLDSLERAWAQRDREAVSESCSDEATVFIVRPRRDGPTAVLSKAQVVSAAVKAWERPGFRTRRFVSRDISVYGDMAWMFLEERDRFTDGREETRWSLKAALQRGGTWRMCFSMPLLFERVVLVEKIVPGYHADRMDARAGDIVESYAGRRVQDARALIDLVMLHKGDKPATTLRLVIVRGGKKVALDAPPGSLGLKVVDRLLPVREATLVGAGKSHPVKDLLRAELEALKAGELGGYAKRFFCPAGLVVLAPQPGKPIQVLTLADIEGAVEKQYAQVRASLRLDTAKFEKLQLIADGDIALACGKFAVEPRDANAKTIRPPIGLKVHVRLNGKWGMAAGFPGNVAMGLDIQ